MHVFMHIYSDMSYLAMINTMSLRFRENILMSLPKVCCIGPLSSMKKETFIQILNGHRLYTAKKAVIYVYLVASFLSLELHMLHTNPGFENYCSKGF